VKRAALVERVAVAVVAIAYLYAMCFRDGVFVYLFHKVGTGAWLDEGARVAAGEVPYRDFGDRVGPGLLYLHALLVRTLGARIDVMAWAGIAAAAAATLALHALAGAIVRGPWRLAPPAIFLFLVFPGAVFGSHVWLALLFSTLAVLALVRGAPAPAGAAAGLAVAFTPGMGAAVAAGLLLHIIVGRGARWPRRAGAFAGGFAIVVGLPLAVLAARAGLGAVLSGWFGPRLPAGSLLDVTRYWSARNAGYLALAAIGAACALRPALGRAEDGPALVARAGLLAVLPVLLGGGDAHALAVHATLLAVPAAAAAAGASSLGARARGALWAGAAVMGFCTLYAAAATLAWRQWLQPSIRQRVRAGETWLGAPNRELAWLESQTRPGEAAFVFPAGGAYFFLTHTRNATSFPLMMDGFFGDEPQRRALAELDAARPRAGIWIAPQRFTPAAGRPTLDALYEGVMRRYVTERALPDGTLLLRRRE
jgi:hypothetical protein